MYKKQILSLYNKSFDVSDCADEILHIAVITQKSRITYALALLLAIPTKLALVLTGVALWSIAMALSGAQAPRWNKEATSAELTSITNAIQNIHSNPPTYTGLRSASGSLSPNQ